MDKRDTDYIKIPENWDDSDLGDFTYREKPKKKWSSVFKFFMSSTILLIIALIFASFSFFNNYSSFSEKNINIFLAAPVSLTSGEESSIDISITNNNPIPIMDAYVLISYDSGEDIVGEKKLKTERVDLGQVLPSMSINKSLPVILFGSEGSNKEIKAVLYYKLSSSKAEFNKNSDNLLVLIKTSPVSISVKTLNEVRNNSLFNLVITVKNNTYNEMGNLIVSVRPPNEFIYSSSSLPLYNKNPSWIIKNLPSQGAKDITLTGKISGDVGSAHNFSFFVGVSENKTSSSSISIGNNDNYNLSLDNIYSKVERRVAISGQYLDISLSSLLEENISAGELMILDFTYKNNLDYPLDNVSIVGELFSDIVDQDNTLPVLGYYNKSTNTIVWDKNSMIDLSQLKVGETGKFRLQIRIKRDAKIGETLRLRIFSRGDRNSETGVSNEQDVSFEKIWVVGE